MLHVALRFITAQFRNFAVAGSANRCDLAEIRVGTLPENNRDVPHFGEPMMRGDS